MEDIRMNDGYKVIKEFECHSKLMVTVKIRNIGGFVMEITKNVLENMMMMYVDHKKIMIDMENDHGDEEGLYEDAAYNFHRGCCEMAESWMRVIGVSPQCNFITEKLYG